MKVADIFILALRNVMTQRKTSIQIFGCFFFAVALIMSLVMYSSMLNTRLKETTDKYISVKYVEMDISPDYDYQNLIKSVMERFSISDVRLSGFVYADEEKQEKGFFYIVNYAELNIDGKNYTVDNDHFGDEYLNIDFVGCSLDYGSWISDNEIKEFKSKFKRNSVYLAGGDIEKENDVILSQKLLKSLGVDCDNPEQLIGSNISLMFNSIYIDYINMNPDEASDIVVSGPEKVLINHRLCGIVDDDINKIYSRRNPDDTIIIVPLTENIIRDNEGLTLIFSIDDFRDVNKIKKHILSEFGLHSSSSHYEQEFSFINSQKLFLEKILMLAGIIIIIAIMFNIVRIFMFSCLQKQTIYGMLKAIGMKTPQILAIISLEIGNVSFLAMMFSAILSCFLISGMTSYISDFTGIEMHFTFSVMLNGFFVAVSFCLICALLNLIVVNFWILKSKVTVLLK